MIKPADKRAAFAALCMVGATVVMVGLGVTALLMRITLTVSGLFLMMAVPCGIVAFSLGNVAIRGRQPAAEPAGAAGEPESMETVSEAAPAE